MNAWKLGQTIARKPGILFVRLWALCCNSLISSCFLFESKTSA